jgi:hypothetical protein
MISAKDARAIVDSSEKALNRRLELIEGAIMAAAGKGENELLLDHALPYSEEFKIDTHSYGYSEPKLDSRIMQVVNALKQHGYQVKLISRDHDGTAGGRIEEHEATPFKTWHIQVKW